MRVSRNDDRHRIVRDVNAIDSTELASVLRAHVNRDGLNRTEASMLHRVHVEGAPREPTNAQAVALGTLLNAGLVVIDELRPGGKERPLVLSEEVRFSLLLVQD